ncbi:FIG00018398: hypothetical regulator [hydrothermal vent metagenome]|uniref:FIG00018398: hypothetical regulator n=1 Tax=hydrothermal vent metagenome TaxID=652676 RepID=A0A3B0U876_9ZZZZ
MSQLVLVFASLFGMFSVILGAFGAHKLKSILTTDLMQSFETGVKYQFYHAIVLLVLGFNLEFNTSLENWIVYCFISGTILFSFSIYALTLSSAKGKKLKFLGPITPIGGLLLTMGWILLVYFFISEI